MAKDYTMIKVRKHTRDLVLKAGRIDGKSADKVVFDLMMKYYAGLSDETVLREVKEVRAEHNL